MDSPLQRAWRHSAGIYPGALAIAKQWITLKNTGSIFCGINRQLWGMPLDGRNSVAVE
jgi:hypothetical protein